MSIHMAHSLNTAALQHGFLQGWVLGPAAAAAELGSLLQIQIHGPTSDLLSHNISGLQPGISATRRQGFSTWAPMTFGPNYSHLWGPVLCGMFSSIPALNLVDISNSPHLHFVVMTIDVPRPWQAFPGGTISPWVKNQCGRGLSQVRARLLDALDCGTYQGFQTHLWEPLTLYYPSSPSGFLRHLPSGHHYHAHGSTLWRKHHDLSQRFLNMPQALAVLPNFRPVPPKSPDNKGRQLTGHWKMLCTSKSGYEYTLKISEMFRLKVLITFLSVTWQKSILSTSKHLKSHVNTITVHWKISMQFQLES